MQPNIFLVYRNGRGALTETRVGIEVDVDSIVGSVGIFDVVVEALMLFDLT